MNKEQLKNDLITKVSELKRMAIFTFSNKGEVAVNIDFKKEEENYIFIKNNINKIFDRLKENTLDDFIFNDSKYSIFNEFYFFLDLVDFYYEIFLINKSTEESLIYLKKKIENDRSKNVVTFLSCFFYHFIENEYWKDAKKYRSAFGIIKKDYVYSFSDFLKFKIYSEKITQSYIVVRLLDLLSLLAIDANNIYERKVAHYTNITVANYLLLNDVARVRMNSTEFMNDPMEGELLDKYLNLNSKQKDNLNFLTSYTFNHNHLNQFRLYGKTKNIEGTGVSLVLDSNLFFLIENSIEGKINELFRLDNMTKNEMDEAFKFNKLPIFRCCYFDPETEYVELARRSKLSFFKELKGDDIKLKNIEEIWKQYLRDMVSKEKMVLNILLELKMYIEEFKSKPDSNFVSSINDLLSILNYLFKHAAFREEEECRTIFSADIKDRKIKNFFDEDDLKTFTYVDYDIELMKYWKNIYIGPASFTYLTYFKKALSDKKLHAVKVNLSDHPLRC